MLYGMKSRLNGAKGAELFFFRIRVTTMLTHSKTYLYRKNSEEFGGYRDEKSDNRS
jgi:hypothetical protein